MTKQKTITYCQAIYEAYDYLLHHFPDFIVIGQGLWSPWYVGNSMTGLEKKYGKDRIIDSPVAENATTAAALGASLTGLRPMVVHPRMDFMVLATDAIVNQVSKWQSMMGGGKKIPLTIRGIINRGGEQGAQHSQALHSWYGHIPGLKVVMPSSPLDARDLMIASVVSDDPVLYIDDRWCYDLEENYQKISTSDLSMVRPLKLSSGMDLTLVGTGFTTYQCIQASKKLCSIGIHSDVFDLRIINPINCDKIIESVNMTQNLIVVDGGWKHYGLASEIIANVAESISNNQKTVFHRISTKNTPAPSSARLEENYYIKIDDIVKKATEILK